MVGAIGFREMETRFATFRNCRSDIRFHETRLGDDSAKVNHREAGFSLVDIV